MNNIELKYSDLEVFKADLAAANAKLESAISSLKESTDFGSSVMQATWKFGNKEYIFDTVRNSIKSIKGEIEENTGLSRYFDKVDEVYEQAGKKQKSEIISADMLNKLIIAGKAISFTSPAVFTSTVALWLGGKISSNISSSSKHKFSSAKNSPGFASTLTTGNPFGNKKSQNISTPVTTGTTILNDPVLGKKPVINTEDPIKKSDAINSYLVNNSVDAGSAKPPKPAVENVSLGLTSAEFNAMNASLQKYKNAPYVWGGSSVNGVDCSGLVMSVYREAGIKNDFVHSASGQYNQCEPIGAYKPGKVDLSKLKKGDLIFYSNGSIGEIGHSAIYMGDGQVISALNGQYGVTTTKIDAILPYTNIYAARVKK